MARFWLLKRGSKRRDLLAVKDGQIRVQQWRRRIRSIETFGQIFLTDLKRRHLVLELGSGHALLDGFDDLANIDPDAVKLAFGGGEARPVLHTQPIHLACELLAEFLEEILAQELLLQRFQNSCLNLVAADSQMIPARPLIACTEAREAIGGAHHEPGAAHAALRQARE